MNEDKLCWLRGHRLKEEEYQVHLPSLLRLLHLLYTFSCLLHHERFNICPFLPPIVYAYGMCGCDSAWTACRWVIICSVGLCINCKKHHILKGFLAFEVLIS